MHSSSALDNYWEEETDGGSTEGLEVGGLAVVDPVDGLLLTSLPLSGGDGGGHLKGTGLAEGSVATTTHLRKETPKRGRQGQPRRR